MELSYGKKDNPTALPSRVVLQIRPTETKDHVRVIKCIRETNQSVKVYYAIEQARDTYGKNLSKVKFYPMLASIGVKS